jgi:folate-binding protein YgfZ
MAILQYQINSRHLTAFAPLTSELLYAPDKNYLFDLAYLSGMHVAGDRAQDFLQGQLSCDLRDVNELQMRKGVMCDLKGRILALLDVVNWSGRGFQLLLPSDLLPNTKASLAKTAMFSRVTLNQANNYQLFGFHLQSEHDLIPFDLQLPNIPYAVTYQENYCCYCLGNNIYVFLVDNVLAQALREKFTVCSQSRGSLAWHELQLQQKRIEIYPESRGLFLPHRLDLHTLDYLSFNKGCYKGQEIIARTHYRAKLKHELKLFKIHSKIPLLSGKKILNEEGKFEVGELVDFCPIADGEYLIAASMVFEHPRRVRIDADSEIISLI